MMPLRDLLEQLEQLKPDSANNISALRTVVDVDSGSIAELKDQALRIDQHLAEQRARYLEHAVMNIHEEQLVQKAAAVAAQAAPAEPEYKAMAAAGLRNHINKYMSLDKHYQVVLAAQRVHLGTAAATSTAGEQEMGLAGSSDQLLGVSPQDIISKQLPEWRKAEAYHKDLLPEVEAAVRATLAALRRDLQQLLPEGVEQQLPSSPGREHLLLLVDQVRGSSREAEQELRGELRGMVEAASTYLQTLAEMTQLLGTITRDCLLGEQRPADGTQLQYYSALVDCYQGKVSSMELTVQKDTYTREECMALRTLRDVLEDTLKGAQEALQAAQEGLDKYSGLGPEYDALVQYYTEIMVSTERLRADMRYAQELEADLEALKVCDDDIYAAGNDRQAGSMSGGQHRF